jgi:hypothetical protein
MNRGTERFGQLMIFLGFLFLATRVLAEEVHMVSADEQKKIVQKVADFLEHNYVYPDIGEKASKRILDKYGAGEYSQYTTAESFARALNVDLEEVSNDKHLAVVYDPVWVTGLREQGEEKDAYLTEDMLEEEKKRNFGFKEIRILSGNVGYIDLRIFFHPKYAGETAVAAMNFVANCDALIVDVRNNGGGWGHMVALLCTYFFDNEEPVQFSSIYSRPEDKTYQSWSLPYVSGKVMPDIPLYILTSKSTFSAAEEFCYNLKHAERATIVGETTRGGAHPIDVKVLSDALVLIMPEWRSIHPKTKTAWEGVGVLPNVEVSAEEALFVAHTRALETLREQAPDADAKREYQWHMDGIQAKRNPALIDVLRMQSYAGTYGPYCITLKNGILYYSRGGRAERRMIAMDDILFLIEDIDDRRCEFVVEEGEVSGITVIQSNGRRTVFEKDGG